MTQTTITPTQSNADPGLTSIQPQPSTNFFTDDNGKSSSMRLMSFISLIAAIVFASLTMTLKDSKSEGIYLTTSFLIAAFAPKAVQKFVEVEHQKLLGK